MSDYFGTPAVTDVQLPDVTVTPDIDPDEVRLKVTARDSEKAKTLAGWSTMRITRGIERCPNDFELTMTERYPSLEGELLRTDVRPGDKCQILLGKDLILTGYVDRISPVFDVNGHTITVAGRGKCQDLVDCSAVWPGGQISNSTVLAVAQKLAEPYGITVNVAPLQDAGPPIPTFMITYGEPAYAVIEFMCRYRGLLAYELPDGSLYLSRATTSLKAASGFEEGVNIERGMSDYSMSLRYSAIGLFSQSTNVYQDIGDLNFLVATALDERVPRYRNLFVTAESSGSDLLYHQQRADWERNRRYGRSQRLSITTDSWRDSAGGLYAPNTLAPVKSAALMALSPKQWLISEVTYRLDESGTHADLLLMPPEAFALPPVVINSFPDVKPLPKDTTP
jgi:prophage tail gpP-like protein